MGEPFRQSAKYYDSYYSSFLDYAEHCDRLGEIFSANGMDGPLRILDLACGTGTHCIELVRRGHSCVGIDASPEMIGEAQIKAEGIRGGQSPLFVVQDMRSLDLRGEFDAAICMFGGFGYLANDQDLESFFLCLNRHLRSGGLFLFEFWNVGGLKDSPHRNWGKAPLDDGTLYVLSESRFDSQQSILKIDMEYLIRRRGGTVQTIPEEHMMRVFSLSEVRRILAEHGLELLDTYDGRHMESLTAPSKDTFRILTAARKSDG